MHGTKTLTFYPLKLLFPLPGSPLLQFSTHLTEIHPSDLMDVTSFTDTSLRLHVYIRYLSYRIFTLYFEYIVIAFLLNLTFITLESREERNYVFSVYTCFQELAYHSAQ